jgi:hypothetical protein
MTDTLLHVGPDCETNTPRGDWIHLDRTAGGHQHHCCSGGVTTAGFENVLPMFVTRPCSRLAFPAQASLAWAHDKESGTVTFRTKPNPGLAEVLLGDTMKTPVMKPLMIRTLALVIGTSGLMLSTGCLTETAILLADQQAYSEYVEKTNQLNAQREKDHLAPEPVLGYHRWKWKGRPKSSDNL